MDLVEIAQREDWTPAEFRSQVMRTAVAIGAMELERTPGVDGLVMSGLDDADGGVELLIRRVMHN